MGATLSVEDMMNASCVGGLEAFGELVSRYQDMAVGFSYAILGDHTVGIVEYLLQIDKKI